MSVLLDVAWNLLEPANENITPAQKKTVLDTLAGFVVSRTSLPECLQVLGPLPEGTHVVQRLCDIMRTNSERPPPDLTLQCVGPDGPRKRKRALTWSIEDDNRLIMAVSLYGRDNWPLISRFVGGGRTRGQCSQRWIRVVDPKISRQPWSPEDDERLCEFVDQFGKKSWMRVSDAMGNRSDVQCRYRYGQIEAGKVKREQTGPSDEIVEKPVQHQALSMFTPDADLVDMFEFEVW